jgi:anaerobic selenocysteine-containing dehydrogenase
MPIPIDVGTEGADEPATADALWERLCGGAAVPLNEVRAHPHGLLADVPAAVIATMDGNVDDAARLELADPVMVAELSGLAREASAAIRDADWPFLLTSRRMTEYFNSWGQDIPAVRGRHGANPAFLHPDDMATLRLVDGDLATIESQHGTIRAVVQSAPDVAPATVSIAHCWGGEEGDEDVRTAGSQVNDLISNEGPISDEVGMARQSAIPVRIRPVVPDHDLRRR